MDEDEPYVFPAGTPDGVKHKLIEQHKLQEAEQWAASHSFGPLLQELNQDQLEALKVALNSCLYNGKQRICFLMGLIFQTMETRFNICVACGKNHDKELSEQI